MSKASDDVVAERKRQVEQEGWTTEHDDEHGLGDLAIAACCYAAPCFIYAKVERLNGTEFVDPWPWDAKWDKRYEYGERRDNPGNYLGAPSRYTLAERRDLLVKAGALIIAEIERLDRIKYWDDHLEEGARQIFDGLSREGGSSNG